MKTKSKIWSALISLAVLAAIPAGATAAEMPASHTNQFRRIEQPLGLKVGVTFHPHFIFWT